MVATASHERRFYVYIFFRLDGSPCYVGKGQGRRWLQHECKKTTAKHPNHRLAKIIEEANGIELPKVKIRENLTNAEACEIEIAFIKAIGRGHKGPLVNMTDGGEGNIGWNPTQETRQKMSHSGRMREHPKTGPCSPERRAAISAAKTGKPINYPKTHKGKGVPKATEHCGAISEAHKLRAKNRNADDKMMFSDQIKRGWITRRTKNSGHNLTTAEVHQMIINQICNTRDSYAKVASDWSIGPQQVSRIASIHGVYRRGGKRRELGMLRRNR